LDSGRPLAALDHEPASAERAGNLIGGGLSSAATNCRVELAGVNLSHRYVGTVECK
jgi:hypothetical protein